MRYILAAVATVFASMLIGLIVAGIGRLFGKNFKSLWWKSTCIMLPVYIIMFMTGAIPINDKTDNKPVENIAPAPVPRIGFDEFRGHKFGTPPTSTMIKRPYDPALTKDGSHFYDNQAEFEEKGEKLTIGEVKLSHIFYHYYRNKLWGISFMIKNEGGTSNDDILVNAMNEKYKFMAGVRGDDPRRDSRIINGVVFSYTYGWFYIEDERVKKELEALEIADQALIERNKVSKAKKDL